VVKALIGDTQGCPHFLAVCLVEAEVAFWISTW